jgi:hypothetical protein
MSDDKLYDPNRDPDEPPRYAYWVPEDAVRNLTMEKTLHGHETHVQLAKRLLDESLPLAVMSVTHIAINSNKDEMRLAASKYIMEHAMGSPGKTSDLPNGKHAWENIMDAVLVDAKSIKNGVVE